MPAVLLALLWFTIVITLLSLVRHPHWIFRTWDFPRVQIASTGALAGVSYALLCFRGTPGEWLTLLGGAAAMTFQVVKIWPYTPFAGKRVERADKQDDASTVSLMVSNVLMENEQHDRFLATVSRRDPDLVLGVEFNARWMAATECLRDSYPYVIARPQENYYGMVLFSKLPLVNSHVKYLIQDDVPSIHTGIELRSGAVVYLHCVHPRPPEPVRDQDAKPRDAELVSIGRYIGDEEDRPTIVAGDLNDVAWSHTSQMFLRLSGLLDPRMGRGFYNSYHAQYKLCRFPLDHVFHSNDFKLVDLQRLPEIGSDHFPIYIRLLFDPSAEAEQPEPEERPGDQQEAQEKIRDAE